MDKDGDFESKDVWVASNTSQDWWKSNPFLKKKQQLKDNFR
jgi:hypothetical protein